jgi:Xaa-Pro dipeptidase
MNQPNDDRREYQDRQGAAARALETIECDALLSTPGTNLRYLTGLTIHRMLRLCAHVLPREGGAFMVAPAFEESNVRRVMSEGDFVGWDESHDPYRLLAERLTARFGADLKLGIEPTTWFWMAERIRAALPRARLVDAGPVLDRMRSIKSPHELDRIRQAGELAEAAVHVARLHLREEMTELEAAETLIDAVKTDDGFHEPLVQFGPNSAIPHATAGHRRLERGDMVLFDLSGMVGGYLSDITRMTTFGDATTEMKKVFDIVLEAQQAAIAKAAPGVPCQELDRAARQVITRAGYGEFFTHRTGHGLGLDIHEPPFLVEGNTAPLEPGQVVTIEPGIYLPGKFGVRIEDDIVITARGCEVLTDGQPSLVETP